MSIFHPTWMSCHSNKFEVISFNLIGHFKNGFWISKYVIKKNFVVIAVPFDGLMLECAEMNQVQVPFVWYNFIKILIKIKNIWLRKYSWKCLQHVGHFVLVLMCLQCGGNVNVLPTALNGWYYLVKQCGYGFIMTVLISNRNFYYYYGSWHAVSKLNINWSASCRVLIDCRLT